MRDTFLNSLLAARVMTSSTTSTINTHVGVFMGRVSQQLFASYFS